MHENELILVYVTTNSAEHASKLANDMVHERLAACANLIPGMKSIYHWEGKVCSDEEFVVIFKTRRSLAEKLTQRIKELHHYTVPCVLHLPVLGGNTDYLDWLTKETS